MLLQRYYLKNVKKTKKDPLQYPFKNKQQKENND